MHWPSFVLVILAASLTVQSSFEKQSAWTTDGWRAYHDSWAVEIHGGSLLATEVALRHGLVNRGQIGSVGNYYHFTLEGGRNDASNKTSDLASEQSVGYVLRQVVKKHVKRDYKVPADPEWLQQWSLKNTGDVTKGSSNMDLHVEAAWLQNIDGSGVVTTIVDDGVEKGHSDLKDNYNQYASWDFWDEDSDPSPANKASESHGTNCAGEVGMVKNSNCGIGVAHGGTVGGIRVNLAGSSDVTEARALSHKCNYTDVYSNSWGPADSGFVVEGPGPFTQLALLEGVSHGRAGKGCIYVWAAGNGGKYYDSCAADGYASSIYTIAVGSADQRGAQAYYDEPCAAKMAVTYSYNSASSKQITTTTLNGKCTDGFTGTSASAPLLAGTIALVLQANSNLSWRDIQYLLVYTSDSSQLTKGDWMTNSGGRRISQLFGFGAVDVEAMVTRAKRWITVPPQRTVIVFPSQLKLQEASVASPSFFSFAVGRTAAVRFVEHVTLRLTLTVQGYRTSYSLSTLCKYLSTLAPSPLSSSSSSSLLCDNIDSFFGSDGAIDQRLDSWLSSPHARRGDIQVELTSPRGTTSVLLPYRKYDFVNVEGYTRWPFMTVRHWGEDPAGEWNVTVFFRSSEGNVSIDDVELTLYGTADVPLAVKAIPTVCDKSCARDCVSSGADGCDACAKGYVRDTSTLNCLTECPKNTTEYSGYCVVGRVIFPDNGGELVLLATTISIVALTICVVLLTLAAGAFVCYRRKRIRIYNIVESIDTDEWQ